MSTKDTVNADVGVIVGRFQVHELHEAHIALIDIVAEAHDKTLIFIGLSPLRNTTTNPLDFASRRKMINEKYPDVEVHYIEDNRSDAIWSKTLDREIRKWTKPNQTVLLYGSRDSFIQHYVGDSDTKELESTFFISGTEIRRRISNNFEKNKDFRAGVISASFDRYPTSFTTVDIAIMNDDGKILMGKKANEQHVRFIGGFASPDSPHFEADARREVKEEAGVEIEGIKYVGSTLVNDWRYKSESDKIKTIFFVAKYVYGRPTAGDDIEHVVWVSIEDLLSGSTIVMDEHFVLVDMLREYAKNNTL